MRHRTALLALLAALLPAALAAPAQAEDFQVNVNHDDGNDVCSDGQCTLRDAVIEAVQGDRVLVPADTYELAQGSISLIGDTVVGAGARTTRIVGAGEDRVFYVPLETNSVSGVTITGGEIGGQPLSGIGGGVLVQSVDGPTSLTLTSTTIAGNEANQGGGLANFGGTVTVVRSTVSGNRASAATSGSQGGGIYTTGDAQQGITTLSNSTVSGNTSSSGESLGEGGGIYVVGGTLVAQNATIANNLVGSAGQATTPSAIHRSPQATATVTVSHSIVAGGGLFACVGGPFGGTRNVVESASCGSPVANPLLGPLANNGGPTDTHAIGASSPAVNGGTSCEPTDQRGVARAGACDIGAYEYTGALPPPPPPPPGDDDDDLPPPVAGQSVNVLPKSGTVKVKLPGSKRFRTLAAGEQLPVGTVVDTLKGRITLVAAGGQTADFYGGVFKIGQGKGAMPLTTLTLVEKLSCAKPGKASAAAKKKRKRRLWGDGKGRFRTKGKYSAATVRGTKWLTEDRCGSTLTRVRKGRVAVRDFVKRKTVVVRAGKKYVAKRRR